MLLESFLKRMLTNRLLLWGIHMQELIAIKSLYAAIREQGLLPIYHKLTEIVPDITHQYTSFDVNSEYLKTNVRAQHSFRIFPVNEALQPIRSSPGERITIVDIGDSAGTHLQYIKGFHQDRNIRSLSVNVDSEAVSRIKEKGLDATWKTG
jgi:hypothetical protein